MRTLLIICRLRKSKKKHQFKIMKLQFLCLLTTVCFLLACHPTKKIQTAPNDSGIVYNSVGHPVMTFEKSLHDFGKMKKGETKSFTYKFTNTGDTDLNIEIVSACDCTSLEWPEGKIIKPGGKGEIKATFNSTKESLGENLKTIDIVANTDPIIVEVKFKAFLVE